MASATSRATRATNTLKHKTAQNPNKTCKLLALVRYDEVILAIPTESPIPTLTVGCMCKCRTAYGTMQECLLNNADKYEKVGAHRRKLLTKHHTLWRQNPLPKRQFENHKFDDRKAP